MFRHDASLVQINMRQHHSVASDQPPMQSIRYRLLGHVIPAIMLSLCLCFCLSHISASRTLSANNIKTSVLSMITKNKKKIVLEFSSLWNFLQGSSRNWPAAFMKNWLLSIPVLWLEFPHEERINQG